MANIKEEKISYKNGLPYDAKLCVVRNCMPHFHEYALELVYCLEGSVNIIAGHQRVTVHEGEIFSLDPEDIHYLFSETDNLLLIFHLDIRNLSVPCKKLSTLFFACESCHCKPYQEAHLHTVEELILALSYRKYAGIPGSKELANYLINILVTYFDWFNYDNETDQTNDELHDRFYRVIEYCNAHYYEKISINTLAKSEHINANYFSQFFKNTVFINFRNLLNYLRCYEAERLLLTTDMRPTDISYACGFSEPKYFYKNFEDWWKVKPSEDRELYRVYTSNPENITLIEDAKAAELLEKHIAKWHVANTMHLLNGHFNV